MNSESKRVIGDKFERDCISYVDFHLRDKKRYGDCCECVRTDIINKYRWPEPEDTKFVPESLVYDRVGMECSLICTNDVLEYKEYMGDGITKNVKEYMRKNIVGYLYDYVSKLDDVIPFCDNIAFKKKILYWKLYWNAVKMDKSKKGPRVKKITAIGWITKLFLPVLNRMHRS